MNWQSLVSSDFTARRTEKQAARAERESATDKLTPSLRAGIDDE
jgi:hypothetical protein